MADSNPQFPYQHLAVLGMDKVKKYVPPPKSSNPDAAAAPPDPESPAPSAKRDE